MNAKYVGKWLLQEHGLTEGYLRLEEGKVVEVCQGAAPSESTRSLILPGFVNAHTHIGDSFAYPAPKGSLEETVAPPNGYKHRMLRSASREQKVVGMRSAGELMLRSGTTRFIDFREEGLEGVEELREALGDLSSVPDPVILGRPTGADASDEELSQLLRQSDGIGMSAVRDWSIEHLKTVSRSAKSQGKRFAIHASESVRENIDLVLDLRPDFIVHMSSATDDDLRVCADAQIPVVVCPRSNEFFGIRLDIPRMLSAGVELALGTDNGMISRPDMFEEMRAAYRLARERGRIEPLDIVCLATFGGRKVLNAPAKITPEIDVLDDLVVVRVRGEEPLLEVCTTSGMPDIEAVIRGGSVWRSEGWR